MQFAIFRSDMSTRQLIKNLIRRFGYEVRRFDSRYSEGARLNSMLGAHAIDLVFDIGANVGQFGLTLREWGYRGRIVSFEPLSTARGKLQKVASRDSCWEVADRVAIGGSNGEVELHIAGNSVSSSILDMLDSHRSAAPESAYVAREPVEVRPLDSFAS